MNWDRVIEDTINCIKPLRIDRKIAKIIKTEAVEYSFIISGFENFKFREVLKQI